VSFLDLFSDKSDLYVSARPLYPDELFRFIASLAPSTQKAWDCGTGNGQAAIALARFFNSVCASDPSAQQVAHAIRYEGVEYSVQPAEATNYPDATFDAVCVAQALHWFDFSAFFQEVKRVLKPQGVFAAWGYDWLSVWPEFDVTFNQVILKVIEEDWAPQNAILWNGYKDVPMPFTPVETPELCIQASWSLYQLLAYVHTWSATRRCMARMGTDFFARAESALVAHWGSPETVRKVVMPLHFLVGRFTETRRKPSR
jgi:SAM-dependent methyltransferase